MRKKKADVVPETAPQIMPESMATLQEISPPTSLFVWQGEEIDLTNYSEFRYWRNPDTGVVTARLLGGGEKYLPVSGIEEAREIEAAVNPFWGRS